MFEYGGTVREGLGGVALRKAMYYWGWALRFQKIQVIPSVSLSLPQGWVSRCKLQSHACLPDAMVPAMMVMD